VFGRRGPAQAKFTPLELRELDRSRTFDVVVEPRDLHFDQGSPEARGHSKQVEMVAATLEGWSTRKTSDRGRTLFLHFFESPVEILGADGGVVGLRTERTAPDGDGNVVPTGEFTDWPVHAVYRAVGYRSQELRDVPFDRARGTIPHLAGRVQTLDGATVAATYVTGWIKRGPVGLIGHTKSDANETVASLLADSSSFKGAEEPSGNAVLHHLDRRGVQYTTWEGWCQLDAYERSLGAVESRDRVKVVERDRMLTISSRPLRPEEAQP
jgi:ferredoxin--NADP+ reductase